MNIRGTLENFLQQSLEELLKITGGYFDETCEGIARVTPIQSFKEFLQVLIFCLKD